MSFPRLTLALLVFALVASCGALPLAAQPVPPADTSGTPAVRLDVEHLAVDSLALTAERVEAHLSIDASVAELLQIDAGLRVEIDSVHVVLNGVEAAADLRVHLDTVARVLLEALRVVDRHPAHLLPDSAAAPATADPRRDR